MQLVEIIGYAASLLVAVSLMMSNIWKLRWINFAGSVIFAIYGLLVKAYPVCAVNSFIACVNIYYLIELSKKRDYFSHLPIAERENLFLNKFLNYYKDDIRKYFPDFDLDKISNPKIFFILRNLIPVGLFVYEVQNGNIGDIKLDYVIPDYRDLKNAHFLFHVKQDFFRTDGLDSFTALSTIKAHQDYLQRIGFQRDKTNSDLFFKKIDS